MTTKPLSVPAVTRGGCYRFVNKTSLRANWNRQEGVVIWVGRRLLYGLGGGCYMGWEGVVIWAGRGLLYAGKPTCRKAAPSKKSGN